MVDQHEKLTSLPVRDRQPIDCNQRGTFITPLVSLHDRLEAFSRSGPSGSAGAVAREAGEGNVPGKPKADIQRNYKIVAANLLLVCE
jgi:hypothetical protein